MTEHASVGDVLENGLNIVHDLVAQHGEQAVHLAGRVAQLWYISDLARCAIFLPLAIFFVVWGNKRLFRWGKAQADKMHEWGPGPVLSIILMNGAVAIVSIVTMIELSSPINWAAAFNPDIALAVTLFGKL